MRFLFTQKNQSDFYQLGVGERTARKGTENTVTQETELLGYLFAE
jgi:hypothetical protein